MVMVAMVLRFFQAEPPLVLRFVNLALQFGSFCIPSVVAKGFSATCSES